MDHDKTSSTVTRNCPRAILLYGILTVLFCNQCVSNPRMSVSVSGDQTFSQAASNQKCKLVGLDRAGEITENGKRYLINGLRDYSIAWIGAHIESVWVQFLGCYTSIIDGANKGFDLSKTSITTCVSNCGNKGFFLTQDHCFCYQNEVKYDRCSATQCQHTPNLLCGPRDVGMLFPRVSGRQCMCHYETVACDQPIQGAGHCLLSTYRKNQPLPVYSAVQCNQTHSSICKQPQGNFLPDIVKTEQPWYQSLLNCYRKDYHILGTRWLPFRLDTGSYWAGPFSMTNIRWGIIKFNDTSNWCVAATKTMEGKVKLIQLPCNTHIPALCFSSENTVTDYIFKTDTYTTLQVNHLPTNLPEQPTIASTDILKTLSGSNTNNDDVTSTVIIVATIGSVMLFIIASLVVLFVFVKRRKVRRQDTATDSLSRHNMPPDEREHGPSSSRGPSGIGQCVHTSDNVYDELNDFRRDRILTSQDMYDHTFTGEMYGHLNAGNYQYSDGDYDHTFSGDTDGTYNQLGTTEQQAINSDYDHVFGGVPETSSSMPGKNTDDSDYDHTFSGDTDGTYNHLGTTEQQANNSDYDHVFGGVPEASSSVPGKHTDDSDRPHTLAVQYEGVNQPDTSAVAPVYAQVIKRHLRNLIPDSE